MGAGTPGDSNQVYEEMKNRIGERYSTFGPVKIVSAVALEGNRWKNVFSVFKILSKDEDKPTEETLDYEYFKICTRAISLEQFLAFLVNLVIAKKFVVPDFVDTQLVGTLMKGPDYAPIYPSNDPFFNSEWPFDYYYMQVDDQFMTAPPARPLLKLSTPLFDSGIAALKHVSGLNLNASLRLLGHMHFLIPYYSAKISQVEIQRDSFRVTINTKGLPANKILGKLYYESSEKQGTCDFKFKYKTVKLKLDFVPSLYNVFILSKDGKPLDFRRFVTSWPELPSGVTIQFSEQEIKHLINLGEGENLEFKEKLSESLPKAVASFANSNGGVIILGVDNDGRIVGLEDKNVEESIQNKLRDKIDPPPQTKIEKHSIDDKTVVVLRVKEGDDKPYVVRDEGVYIRFGATCRLASRNEIDGFYKDKQVSWPRGVHSGW